MALPAFRAMKPLTEMLDLERPFNFHCGYCETREVE